MRHSRIQITDCSSPRRPRRARGSRQFAIGNWQSPIRNPQSNFPLLPTLYSLLPRRRRPAFTLTELLIVMLIISIMAGMTLAVVAGATNMAREQRTRAIIAKLDHLIMERYESYRTRAVPLTQTRRVTNIANPRAAAQDRLTGIRELIRLEMPDRISDLCNQTELNDLLNDNTLNAINRTDQAQLAMLNSVPSLAKSYKRNAIRMMGSGGWTVQYQGAECLYLIINSMTDGDKNALDYFLPEEIGDTDEDGMKEILDAWGQPIEFLRWAPGYVTDPWDTSRAPMVTTQVRPLLDGNGNKNNYMPDPFDPVKCDPRVIPPDTNINNDPFALRPLVISGGRDKRIDIVFEDYDPSNTSTWKPIVYRTFTIPNDPYPVLPTSGRMIGEPFAQTNGYVDNITNHFQQTP